MGSHLKTALLAAAKLRTEKIDIEGIEVTIREVGAMEFAEYGQQLKVDRTKATATLLAGCIVDEDGYPALSVDDARELVKSARVSMPVVTAIMKLSGFGDDAEKEPRAS